MSGLPTVTWMIPVLNGMPYLPLTLKSIENQSYKDYQVVLWDNGSTDGSLEEARRWIPSRLPGTVVADRPLPLGLARAAMMRECESEFCALIDADDTSEPDRLEKQIAFMREHPEVAVLGTHLRKMNSKGDDLGPFTIYPLTSDQIVQEMLLQNAIGQPSALVRRAPVLAVGNYRDFSPTHVEDYDLWLRMAAAGYQLANLPDFLVNYRIHDKSTTHRSMAANRLDTQMRKCLAEAAPTLYGVSRETMELLSLKKSTYAAPAIERIARHLGDEKAIWKSAYFQHSARYLIGKTDLRTRAIVAFKSRGTVGVFREAANVVLDCARYLRDAILRKKG
jgi:glycosyltransferase involved in cell wall biosynthesis